MKHKSLQDKLENVQVISCTLLNRWCKLPRHYEMNRAIFLPKDEPRLILVAHILMDAGAYDLGTYLLSFVACKFSQL